MEVLLLLSKLTYDSSVQAHNALWKFIIFFNLNEDNIFFLNMNRMDAPLNKI